MFAAPLIGLGLVASLAHFPAQADDVSGGMYVKILGLYQSVEEIGSSGSTLVEETGLEPAIELGGNWPAAKGAIDGWLMLSRSTLDYEGQSQLGRPIESETDYRRLRAALGYSYPILETMHVGLHFEWERLERDIAGVGSIAGLNEEMRSNRLLLGVGNEFTIAGRPVDLQLTVVWGLSGTQKVSAPGVIDRVELPEGRTYGMRFDASMPLNPDSKNAWRWALVPTFEYLHSDRSEDRLWTQDGVIRGTLAQPETQRWAAGVGLMAIW